MIPNGHRILIFTQFIATLDILQDYLNLKGVKNLRLDGSTENSKRQKLIDLYNSSDSEYKIFLLSTKAGGLGINLTTADSDFNPHNDVQALNRAHRIGQKNNVMVYRMICKNSVEERIIEAAKHKLMLDTMMNHQNTSSNSEESNTLYQILKFGTKKLFEKDQKDQPFNLGSFEYQVDEEKLSQILDRESLFKQQELEDKEREGQDDGVRDYLSGFKVATIERKVIQEIPNLHKEGVQSQVSEIEDMEDDDFTRQLMNKDDDDKIFQRLLNERKQLEATVLLNVNDKNTESQKEIFKPNQEIQMNQFKVTQSVQKPQSGQDLHQVFEQSSHLIKPTQSTQIQNNIIPQEKTQVVCYEMTTDYAQLIGGIHNGLQNLHHDKTLQIAQQMGSLQASIQPLAYSFDNSYMKTSEKRVKNLNYFIKNQKYHKDYLSILMLNEDQNLTNIIPFIKLWGFDATNIRDFVNAIYKFGTWSTEYLRFYRKIHRQINKTGVLNSLYFVDERVFTQFAKHFFEIFHLIRNKIPSLRDTPEFIFAHKTSNDIQNYLADITTIRAYVNRVETLYRLKWMYFISKSYQSPLEWQKDCDTYILARLLLHYGQGSYQQIISDNIWLILQCPNIISQYQHIPTLKEFFKQLKRMTPIQIQALLQNQGNFSNSKVVLYQKFSKQSFEDVKTRLLGANMQMQKWLEVNEQMEQYCINGVKHMSNELLKYLKLSKL